MSVKKFGYAVAVGLTTLFIWNKYFQTNEGQNDT